MQFLIGFLIFAFAVYGLMIGSAIHRLRKMRWQDRLFYFPTSSQDVDPLVAKLLQGTANKLAGLGFEPAYWVGINEPFAQDGRSSHYQVLYHPSLGTYAQLALHPMPEAGQSVAVDFINFYPDDKVCYTSNGTRHFMGVELEGYDWADPYAPSLEKHWDFHREKIGHYEHASLLLNATNYCDWGNRFIGQYQETMLENGDMAAVAKDTYRLTFPGAWRVIRRMQKANGQLKSMHLAGRDTPVEDMSSEVEVVAHQRQESILGNQTTAAGGKLLLLLVSVVLFLLSFGYRLNIEASIILLAVVFFHELGHIAAMRLFGYRDLQILFIPFLGAVATGKKSACPAWQSAIIYLAGPVPGILLAGILWYGSFGADISWMPLLIALLFFVNFFNLLPIQPLDGGQLANVLIFQRWPRLQILFHGLSVCMFMAMAWWMEEPLLAGLGFMLGFMILHQYREARLLTHVRREHPEITAAPRQDRLLAIYQGIRQLGISWNYATRLQAAKNILERVSSPLPGVKESAVGLSLYLVFLLGTPAVFAHWGYYPVAAYFQQDTYEAPDWQARLESATSDAERIDILVEATDYFYYSERPDDALSYGEQAQELLVSNHRERSLEMADILVLLARIRLDYNDDLSVTALASRSSEDIATAIEIYQEQELTEYSASQLATAYELWGGVEALLGHQERAVQHVERAKSYWLLYPDNQAWFLVNNLQTQARLLVKLGDPAAAETRYLESLDWAKREDSAGHSYAMGNALNELIEFYLDHERYQAVLDSMMQHPYSAGEAFRYYETRLVEMQAWANFKLERYPESEAMLEEAIGLIDLQGEDHPHTRKSYRRADNMARLLLVHHEQRPVHMEQGAQSTGMDNGAPNKTATDIVRLLNELEAIGRSVEEYQKHLECECQRNAGGYRLDQSERTRNVVGHYLAPAGRAL